MIETERLILRDWRDSDQAPFIQMNQDPRVMEYFPALMTVAEVLGMIERMKNQIREKGYSFFAAEQKSDHAFIGFVGLANPTFEADFTPCLEIGWRLAYPYWGKGYATEGARACLDFAFEQLNSPSVYSFTALQNNRSEKVMKKIGMDKVGEFDHPLLADDSPLKRHVLYQVLKP